MTLDINNTNKTIEYLLIAKENSQLKIIHAIMGDYYKQKQEFDKYNKVENIMWIEKKR